MAVVELSPEGDDDVTALRVVAHVAAGDQVIFDGDLTTQPWWPSAGPVVQQLLEDKAGY